LYPVRARLREGTAITIRPIRPDDTLREQAFMQALSPQSRYFRFMSTPRELPPDMLYRFTHPDVDREVALVALQARAMNCGRLALHAVSSKIVSTRQMRPLGFDIVSVPGDALVRRVVKNLESTQVIKDFLHAT
jgi:hypothetical protein